MARKEANRVLVEQPFARDGQARSAARKGGAAPRSVTVNMVESPLGWLKARGMVTQRQFDAGDRLREEWERAQLSPSVTMRWDAAPLGGSRRAAPRVLDPTERQLAAKARFEQAVAAVGPGMSDILWRVVCAGEGMREAERALGWPARAGKLVLGLALNRLADHYRIG